MAEQEKEIEVPELVVHSRPHIQVFLTNEEQIAISVTEINADFERVDLNRVDIPVECAEAVGNTLLAIAKHLKS